MRFLERYRSVFAGLFGPETPVSGMPDEELVRAEKTLGLPIPEALRAFYLSAGGFDPVMKAHNRFYAPDRCFRDGRKVVFLEENQAVVYWGFEADQAGHPDPPVFQGVNRKPIEWHLESDRCSDFLVGMVYWQAVNGGLPCLGFADVTPDAAGPLIEQMALVWQDRDFRLLQDGGKVVSLYAHKDKLQVQAAARTADDLAAIASRLQTTWSYSNIKGSKGKRA